jgi:hypothetical protein
MAELLAVEPPARLQALADEVRGLAALQLEIEGIAEPPAPLEG